MWLGVGVAHPNLNPTPTPTPTPTPNQAAKPAGGSGPGPSQGGGRKRDASEPPKEPLEKKRTKFETYASWLGLGLAIPTHPLHYTEGGAPTISIEYSSIESCTCMYCAYQVRQRDEQLGAPAEQ